MSVGAADHSFRMALVAPPVVRFTLRARRRQRGFTLIELMYALGLFSIGLLGLTQFQISAMSAAQRSADISVATNLASSTIEALKVRSFLEVAGTETAYFDRYGVQVGAPSYFTVVWQGEMLGSYATVVVNVTWRSLLQSAGGHVSQLSMATQFF